MVNSHYNAPLTLKLYVLAAVVFGLYGGRVCPMLETLTFGELFLYISITFGSVYLVRHFLLQNHPMVKEQRFAQLGSNSFLKLAKEISLTHHEKWNGSGYPNGLKEQEIPISGRLMALADVYDALISERVYKKAFSHEKTKSIILEGNGSHFDPEIVEAFLAIEDEFVAIADKYRSMEAKENELEKLMHA
ncbi:HD-GYP domain-containing protein [Vibrio sp. M260112]|uniref:HD-GYP domain-containing protein n=1 Tax=Vibrio sp. M260112 TaxID=3020895 RepID=UPI002F43004F